MKINLAVFASLIFFLFGGHSTQAQTQIPFEQLPPQEQNLLKAGMSLWKQLDAPTQTQLRAQAQHWLTLPPAEQQTLLLKQRQWDRLPSADKSRQRERFAAWQSLGRDAQALNTWLLFIPQDQIKPWLMLLRELSSEQRNSLINLGKRWNQQQRDTFRTRLLSAPVSARSDIIHAAAL